MEFPASSVQFAVEPQPRKLPHWRLRILVVVAALALTLFVISRLEPEHAKKCGPIIESVYVVFNPPVDFELTEGGKQFIVDMAAQLSGTNVKGAGLARFVASRRLTSLLLSGSAITDEGLGHLSGASGLIRLTLYGMPQLTGAGLKNLAVIPSLRYLSLQGCQVSSKDVAQLRASAPELRIEQ